jgi:hypothetical protein
MNGHTELHTKYKKNMYYEEAQHKTYVQKHDI